MITLTVNFKSKELLTYYQHTNIFKLKIFNFWLIISFQHIKNFYIKNENEMKY